MVIYQLKRLIIQHTDCEQIQHIAIEALNEKIVAVINQPLDAYLH